MSQAKLAQLRALESEYLAAAKRCDGTSGKAKQALLEAALPEMPALLRCAEALKLVVDETDAVASWREARAALRALEEGS